MSAEESRPVLRLFRVYEVFSKGAAAEWAEKKIRPNGFRLFLSLLLPPFLIFHDFFFARRVCIVIYTKRPRNVRIFPILIPE